MSSTPAHASPLSPSPVALPARILQALCLFLIFLYLVNCLTPLRLHVDMIRYFGIKDCIEFGCPPDSDAAHDYMPYGYTSLLLLLSKLGLLHSFVLVLINCCYLFGALRLIKQLFGDSLPTWTFLLLVLLNWTTIKFVTHPLSEMQYLFFSCASLYYFYRYTREHRTAPLILSFLFGGLAFLTRTVGIALFAALVAGLAWEYRKQLLVLIKRNKGWVALIVALLIAVVLFSKQLGLTHYSGVMSNQFNKGLTHKDIWEWHGTEWAEITFNTSIVKVERYFPHSTGAAFFLICGLLFFAGFLYVLLFRSKKLPAIVIIYLLFYSVLLFNWPFYDPRFWVPVIPLIIAVLLQSIPPVRRTLKLPMGLLLACYLLLGTASVAYFTYTSLNKKTFARSQANGVYRNEYETLFYGKPQSDTATKTDPYVLSILRRYH